MTPWNVLLLSLATSSTQTISPSPTVMSLNTWGGARGGEEDGNCQLPPPSAPHPPSAQRPALAPAAAAGEAAQSAATLQLRTRSCRSRDVGPRPPALPPSAESGAQTA